MHGIAIADAMTVATTAAPAPHAMRMANEKAVDSVTSSTSSRR